MVDSPVGLSKADAGNGKSKTIVREREYDLRSWQGLKTLFTIVVSVVSVTLAVLTAYYSAEASQNERAATQAQQITKIDEHCDGREKAVDSVLTKFDKTLTAQQILIRDNGGRLIEVQTTQKMMRDQLKEISDDVKKLGKK